MYLNFHFFSSSLQHMLPFRNFFLWIISVFRKGRRSQIKICRARVHVKNLFFGNIFLSAFRGRYIRRPYFWEEHARVSQIGSEDARRIYNNRTTKAHFFSFTINPLDSVLRNALYVRREENQFLFSIITSILHRRDSLSCIGGRQEQRAIDKYTINLTLYTRHA